MARTKFALLAAMAMTAGVLVAQQLPVSDTVMNPLANNPTAVADGQRIYDGTCQTCHGTRGRGRPRSRWAGAQHDRIETRRRRCRSLPHDSAGCGGNADASLQGTARRADLAARELSSEVSRPAHLRRLPRAQRALPRGTSPQVRRCFSARAACSNRHEVNARGGITGPDLRNAGRLTAAAIRQKVVSPNDPLPPPARRTRWRLWPRRRLRR